jgi:DNA-binding MarR family transcriptional regulator
MAHAVSRLRMERSLADLDVTRPQFMVLTMLVAYRGISGADLARLSCMTSQTVNVIVANLQKNGAIERCPHAVRGFEQQLLDGLTDHEEQVIRRWLAGPRCTRP